MSQFYAKAEDEERCLQSSIKQQLIPPLSPALAIVACPIRKFHPAWIRIIRQNRCIVANNACDSAFARIAVRRPVEVARQA